MSIGRFVAYYRVSTKKQGASGLGLDAQREAVRQYLTTGGWPPIAEFVEVESGKNNNRREMERALLHCQLTGATLVIAKLDRLARKVSFLTKLEASGVEFICCDNPHATRFTIHILMAVAEHEAKQISERTTAALAASKARGKVLGGYRGGPVPDAKLAGEAKQRIAHEFANRVAPLVLEMKDRGLSLRQMAVELTAMQIRTAQDRAWDATTVRRVLARVGG